MYTSLEFIRVENNQSITREANPDFYFELQRAVLLSLKDSGKLTLMQYRGAEEILKKQRDVVIRAIHEHGGNA